MKTKVAALAGVAGAALALIWAGAASAEVDITYTGSNFSAGGFGTTVFGDLASLNGAAVTVTYKIDDSIAPLLSGDGVTDQTFKGGPDFGFPQSQVTEILTINGVTVTLGATSPAPLNDEFTLDKRTTNGDPDPYSMSTDMIYYTSFGGSSLTGIQSNVQLSLVNPTPFFPDVVWNTPFTFATTDLTDTSSSLSFVHFTDGSADALLGGSFDIDSVTVTDGAGGVPEPASWALMIAGFGLAGAMLRQRKRLALA